MARHIPEQTVLVGMRDISAYFGVTRNTINRWVRDYGFPLRRNPRPFLLLSDLDGWGKPGERLTKMTRK